MTFRMLLPKAAVIAATAFPAMAQDVSLGLSAESGAAMSSEVGVAAGPLDAQITGDNTYASLTAAINANESVDLSGVTDEAQVNIVLVSTLEGDLATEGTALDAALSAQAEGLTALRSTILANAAINAKLAAGGYTPEDVLAVRTDSKGTVIVFVDDRT